MKVYRVGLVFALLFFTFGCTQSVAIRAASTVPTALGEATVSKDNNVNLAPREYFILRKAVCVVWLLSPQGQTVNLGQMTGGSNRVGKFRGVTPFQ